MDDAFAIADLSGEGGATRDQKVTSAAGAALATLEIRAGGQQVLAIQIEGVSSFAQAACVNGAPALGSSFQAAVIRINGQELNLTDALSQIANALSQAGLDPLIKIEIGKKIEEAGQITIRALEVQVLGAPNPLLDVIVGESKAGFEGDVCAAPPPPACPAGSTFDPVQGICIRTDVSCPAGSVFDVVTMQCFTAVTRPCPPGSTENAQGFCVVPRNPDGSCPAGSVLTPTDECVLIVLVGGPVGGDLVPLDTIPGASASPCSRLGFGLQVAIRGTNRRDSITGTNRSDRIFAFGGKDRVSGGRGNDCVEGGSGNDNLDGSNGNDFLLGGSGRDILNGGTGRDRLDGGSGHDKLTGGSGSDVMRGQSGRDKLSGGLGNDRIDGGGGRDYIDGGNGRDRINGGSGNDAINAATAGSGADTINCGPGRDTVRIDGPDRVRNCERVLVLRSPRR